MLSPKSFYDIQKRDFEEFIINRNNLDNFVRFEPLIEKINEIKQELIQKG